MKLKKLMALSLSLLLTVSMIGCGDNKEEDTTEKKTTPAASVTEEASETTGVSDYNPNAVTTKLNESGGGEVSYDIYAGETGKDYTDPEVYTMNDYIEGTSEMNWSPLNWETNSDSYVLDYISSGFYTFVLNSTKDGWSVACELASELPEDVTEQYVGSYGISEGETEKAWKIKLREDACFEDGTPITADTYIYSYQQLLDPIMLNRRADSLYASEMAIYGAKNYFYGGQTVLELFTEDAENYTYQLSDLTLNSDNVYCTPEGAEVYITLYDALAWCGGYSLYDYSDYFDPDTWAALEAAADENGYVPCTKENYDLLYSFTGGDDWGNESEEDLVNYMCAYRTYDSYSWDGVGILKTGDYEIVLITVNPIEDPSYYVPYNLSGTYLVEESLWESCKTYFDSNGDVTTKDSEDIASITTTYGTSVETTASYGPYKLTYFEMDKQITMERNENWYGYSDGNHLGQYQTDVISCQVIAEHSTALLAFLNGEVDSIALQSEDMETYSSSAYIRYTPESYTTKLTFNTDKTSLSARGTEVLANLNFRKAFSLAIDRNTFAKSYTSAGSAGYGLLNYVYVYDPFTGATYRDTDAAKKAIVDLYGLTYGDDGDYEDLDEAYDAVTGYDLKTAKECMQKAYDECVADGSYDGTSEIELQISVYNSDDIYVKMFNYLNDALTAACEGTGFEGKVSLTMVADADYYNTMYSGGTDIIFTTWGGAAYSPYTMLYECYCDASDGSGNQSEYGFDTSAIDVTITADGTDYTASLQTWALWADDSDPDCVISNGSSSLESFGSYDAETRAAFFAILERTYLSYYATTPIYYRNSATLISQKGDYAVTQYVDLIGLGGIQFYTYDYTDAEWETVRGGLQY